MCATFQPASVKDIEKIVNKDLPESFNQFTKEVFPKGKCPIILNKDGSDMTVEIAEFGLSPDWAKETVSYSSHNARLESITNKRTFKKPYKHSQFCLVPMQAFYEPYYASGKNEWQSIHRKDNAIFTVPAIYEYNSNFAEPSYSFSLLTVNAEENLLMNRFHRPDSEKRTIMMIEPNDRELFLVSNWKFNQQYFSAIDSEYFVHEDKEQNMNLSLF